MRVKLLARQGSVPQHFRDRAEPRLEHLDQYLSGIEEARVSLSEQRGRFTVEITVQRPREIFRSEKRAPDLLEAFDRACAAIEKQLRRRKRRMRDHSKTSVRKLPAVRTQEVGATPESDEDRPEDYELQIVRTKRHVTHPMTPGEATMHLENIGHDFFVFVNVKTREPSAVYRRRGGGYGLIELEVEQHPHAEVNRDAG